MKWALQFQDILCPVDKNGHTVPRRGFMFEDMCSRNLDNDQKNIAALDAVFEWRHACLF